MHNPVHNRTTVLTMCLFVLVNVKLLISRQFYTKQTPITLNGSKYFVRYGQSTILHNPVHNSAQFHNFTILLTTEDLVLDHVKSLKRKPFYTTYKTFNEFQQFVTRIMDIAVCIPPAAVRFPQAAVCSSTPMSQGWCSPYHPWTLLIEYQSPNPQSRATENVWIGF